MQESNKKNLLPYIYVDKYGILYYIKGANQLNIVRHSVPRMCILALISVQVNYKLYGVPYFGIPYKIEVLYMCTMYGVIEQLCADRGIKPGKLCADLKISRGILSDLKAGRTKKLSAQNLAKVATYLGVTVDYILEKSGYKTLELFTGVGSFDLTSLKKETDKAPTENGERAVSDAELKFALWGDCEDVDDDDLADVRRYAAFVRERKKDRK